MSTKAQHLQKNGAPYSTACRAPETHKEDRTWNLVEVTCEECKRSDQFRDLPALQGHRIKRTRDMSSSIKGLA